MVSCVLVNRDVIVQVHRLSCFTPDAFHSVGFSPSVWVILGRNFMVDSLRNWLRIFWFYIYTSPSLPSFTFRTNWASASASFPPFQINNWCGEARESIVGSHTIILSVHGLALSIIFYTNFNLSFFGAGLKKWLFYLFLLSMCWVMFQ